MKIGILTAMAVEHEQICKLLIDPQVERDGETTYTVGRIATNDIILLQCGIGKVNAAVGTTQLLHRYSPDMVISTGCAGGIDASLRVMDVVASDATAYHDVWCGEGNAYGQVQGLPARFAASPHLLEIVRGLQQNDVEKEEDSTRICVGLICTGDKFITDRDVLSGIKQDFPDALAVDMESAAIAHTCHLHRVPFLSFRVISDTPGVDNHWQQYQDFWGEMAHRSFEVTHRFLKSISH